MKLSELNIIIMLISTLVEVEADPTCSSYGDKSVVCIPGDADYVLKRGLVSDNNVTTSITLRGCRITDLDKEALKHLISLKYLDLSRNMITNITLEHLDTSLPELLHLNLSYNRLTVLTRPVLEAMVNLQILDLRGNKLAAFDVAASTVVGKLQYLDISDNELSSMILNQVLFLMNSNLRHLDISRHDLSKEAVESRCFFMLTKQLEVLHLDGCNMFQVPNITCSNLKTIKHLTLSANQVNRIPTHTFNALLNLEVLDLSKNNIDTVEDNAFKNNDNLKTIILRNNKLNVISENVFRALPRLANLDLSYNLIEDVPVNAFRASPLRNFNLAGNRFTYLQNNFCLELRNSRATLRKFYFNQNPWQCACLKDILDEVKKYDIEYNDAKYNGMEPVCAVGERFTCERQQSENERYTEIYDRVIEQYYLYLRNRKDR